MAGSVEIRKNEQRSPLQFPSRQGWDVAGGDFDHEGQVGILVGLFYGIL